LENRKKIVIFVIIGVDTMKDNKKDNKKNKEESNTIKYIGTRAIRDFGISGFLDYVESNGMGIITTYNKPRAMIIPLSYVGLKKSFKQIENLYKNIDEKDEITLSVQAMLEDMSKIINEIDVE
jgi:hypothetical protein